MNNQNDWQPPTESNLRVIIKDIWEMLIAFANVAFIVVSLWPVAIIIGIGLLKTEVIKTYFYHYSAILGLCTICLYASVPVARVIVRSFPPFVQGRGWAFRVTAVIVACYIIYVVVNLVQFLPEKDVDICQSAVGIAFVGLVGATVITTIGRYVAVWQGQRDKGVLYLRSFSYQPGEQSVVRGIIRALPQGLCFRSLTSTRQRPGHFEVFLTSFAGWNLLRPLRFAPTFLKSDDLRWRDWVHCEIERARIIIVECSIDTEGLRNEIDIIRDSEKWSEKTLFICSEKSPKPAVEPKLRYQIRWASALPRIIIQLLYLVMSALFLSWFLIGLNIMVLGRIPGEFVWPVLYTIYGLFLTLQPSISSRSYHAIRDSVHQIIPHKTST